MSQHWREREQLDDAGCRSLRVNERIDRLLGERLGSDPFETREGDSVDELDRQGAGDQGIMFGFATRETPTLMPLPIWLAHRLSERLAAVRHEGLVDWLRPDGKTQVTVGYDGSTPRSIETIVVSTQHSPNVSTDDLRAAVE